MPITPRVSPKIVLDIANNYQSTSRILMEYIDNSIDSAETAFNPSTNQYNYPIFIQIKIDSLLKKVTFTDNCKGMTKENLLRIAEDIGASNKKGDYSTNGQFGFGVHSYAACAKDIMITTFPYRGSNAYRLIIDRKKAYEDNGEIDDIQTLSRNALSIKGASGTEVIITNFDREWWKQVDPNLLKKEVEDHFEQLLYRDNLTIKIIFDDEEEICKGFDYDHILGKVVERTVKSFSSTKNGVTTKLEVDVPLKIYLKITDAIVPDKRPIFTNKGRRIEEIQNIPSYKRSSKHKADVWGHSNLVGYIEVAGLLDPKQTRDDFTWSSRRGLVYEQINQVEDEIYKELQEINKKIESANLGRLESFISSALSKLAKEESMRFRTEYSSGNQTPLTTDVESESELPKVDGEGTGGGEGGGEGGGGGGGGSTGGSDGDINKIPVVETIDDDMSGNTKKTSGMNIRISNQTPPEINAKLLRSHFLDGVGVIIYSVHPDFEARVTKTRRGEMRITQRLVSYIASEIAIHFKDRFYEIRKTQPEIQNILSQRMDLMEDITNFIYRFDDILQGVVGKDLQTLEGLED